MIVAIAPCIVVNHEVSYNSGLDLWLGEPGILICPNVVQQRVLVVLRTDRKLCTQGLPSRSDTDASTVVIQQI